MNQPIILKFGGTSMGDEDSWRRVMKIIETYTHPVVVVSATAYTTRKLIKAAKSAATDYRQARQISGEIEQSHISLVKNLVHDLDEDRREPITAECLEWIGTKMEELNTGLEYISEKRAVSPAQKDAIASIGEQLSSYLFAHCCIPFGISTRWIDARKLIKTDSNYENATPIPDKISAASQVITRHLDNHIIPVVGGYYGEDHAGNITTLGFEGSDYTASLLGSALEARSIEIWTDVSGIYTCDPRVVKEAEPIQEINFREATEMAYFGAKVLHPSTLKPAAHGNIPVLVKNIFKPGDPGTKIHGEVVFEGAVRAITFVNDIVIITVTSPATIMGYQFLSGVFEILENRHIAVDVVTTTEASVSIALERPGSVEPLIAELDKLGEVSVSENRGLISLIGCNLSGTREIHERILSQVKETEISMISFSRAKRNLNLVLPEKHLVESVISIHRSIFGPG